MSEAEETHTFYRHCYCRTCRVEVPVAVQHTTSEIPEKLRESTLEQLRGGKKLIWPLDPKSREEGAQIAASGTCPKEAKHPLEYIWNMGVV